MAPRRIQAAAVLAAAALAAACSGPPSTTTPSALPAAASVSAEPRQEIQALTARGDWAGAVIQYRRALATHPDDFALHFGLASALSHLGRVQDAAEEFGWVVKHGPASSVETAAAREWLVQAGLLPADTPRTAEAPPVPPDTAAASAAGDDEMKGTPYGTVRGVTQWPAVTAQSNVRLDIRLTGDDEKTAGKRYPLHIMLGQPYTLGKVPAGAWRLAAKSGETVLWETRVVVEPSKETVVDLTPEKSSVRPSEFSPR
jgi:Tetratricopeptide repeat